MKGNLWPGSIEEARKIQYELKKKIEIRPLKRPVRFIAATDAAFSDKLAFAAATLYRLQGLVREEDSLTTEPLRFPYIPGLLAFREGRAITNAIGKLSLMPDAVLIDGHGIAHPEGIGIASHVGVLLDIAAVGCAKTRLIGEYEEPGPDKGEWVYLYHRGMKVGAVLRTRTGVKPLFISPGHLTDIESSVEIVMKSLSGFRIPEPLRTADRLSRQMKRDHFGGV